jgi:polysaccharide biosynthesis transport protein
VELRQYLDILKRHKWFIIESIVVVGLVAGILSALRTPTYQATARVLLRPNDPNEQVGQTNNNSNLPSQTGNDPERYVSAQKDIIRSPGVAEQAASSLSHISARDIDGRVKVTEDGESNVLDVSVSDMDPVRARDITNAVANGYIENRRKANVAGLQAAADQIGSQLTQLETRISQLDNQLQGVPATGSATAAKTAAPAAPAGSGVDAPDPAAQQPDAGGLAGGVALNSQQAVTAARYAAAVQYQTLYAQQQNLLVDVSLQRGQAELITPAASPTHPISPNPKRDGAIGALAGLFLGGGMVFLREQLDDRLRSVDDVERATGLAAVGEIPFDEEVARDPSEVAGVARPQSPVAESIRAVRTSLQFLGVDEPLQTILVTSPGPGDGKSFVAANLAAAYAQAGYTTCLVSADLRKPRLHAMFSGSDGADGLTDLIARLAYQAPDGNGDKPAIGDRNGNGALNGHGNVSDWARGNVSDWARSTMVATPLPNLWLLPAGQSVPNPAEVLGSRRMSELMAGLRSVAEVIIVDTPPLLAVTDAAVAAAHVDGVVLVAALGATHRDGARRTRALTDGSGTRVLGVVVNKVPPGKGSYYAGYYGDASGGRPSVLRRLPQPWAKKDVVPGPDAEDARLHPSGR